MNRAQAELKAFEKKHGISSLNRGDVADHVLTQWKSKKQAYGDAGRAADTKQKQVWGTADRRGGLNQQDVASLRSIGRAGDVESTVSGAGALRTDATRDINTSDRRVDQRRIDKQNHQQRQAERDSAHSEDRRRQAIARRPGPVSQSTRDLSGQDRRFNERVTGYDQSRRQRGSQEARGMQERSARGRRQGKLSGGGQKRGGGFSGIATALGKGAGGMKGLFSAVGDIAKDRGVAPRGDQIGGQRGGGRSPIRGGGGRPPMFGGGRSMPEAEGPTSPMRPAPEPTPTKGEGWWNEPRKAATSEEGRIALLTGKGGGSGSVGTTSNAADRIAFRTTGFLQTEARYGLGGISSADAGRPGDARSHDDRQPLFTRMPRIGPHGTESLH